MHHTYIDIPHTIKLTARPRASIRAAIAEAVRFCNMHKLKYVDLEYHGFLMEITGSTIIDAKVREYMQWYVYKNRIKVQELLAINPKTENH